MAASAVAVLLTLSVCAAVCPENENSTRSLWSLENEPMEVKLAALIKEMENLKCEQTALQQQKLSEVRRTGAHRPVVGTYPPSYGPVGGGGAPGGGARRRGGDPCFHYTVLDQAWRATNATSKTKRCDRNVKWKGWYRLFLGGRSLQMPERCVPAGRCGTDAPLWLAGRHPRRGEGAVTRAVCGRWGKDCCAYRSNAIQVKKCRGNYYVYKLAPPTACYLAYCADINTLVCGRCRRNESCVSRDKINWRCKRKRTSSRKVHFFASYPAQISGKMNRIKFSRVLVNVGRGFDRRSGVFRAPVGGVYQFFFSTQTAPGGARTELWLVVNGYWVSASQGRLPRTSTVGSLNTYMSFLRRGARVHVTHNCGRSWANASSTTISFGGSLLLQGRNQD